MWRNASSERYEVDDGDDIDEDTLNHMMARFGSSVGSLGLGGAIQGAPMIRRGSISTAMRRPSLARRPSRPVQEDRSIQSPDITVDLRTRRDSSSRAPQGDICPPKWSGVSSSVRRVASIDDSKIQAPEKRSKYLGGTSEARFWAVFSSILLVYFVSWRFRCRVTLALTANNRLHALIPHLWHRVIRSLPPTFTLQIPRPGCPRPFCLPQPPFNPCLVAYLTPSAGNSPTYCLLPSSASGLFGVL
jgi:hypothetical protein